METVNICSKCIVLMKIIETLFNEWKDDLHTNSVVTHIVHSRKNRVLVEEFMGSRCRHVNKRDILNININRV